MNLMRTGNSSRTHRLDLRKGRQRQTDRQTTDRQTDKQIVQVVRVLQGFVIMLCSSFSCMNMNTDPTVRAVRFSYDTTSTFLR
jgi:hypothetical protein